MRWYSSLHFLKLLTSIYSNGPSVLRHIASRLGSSGSVYSKPDSPCPLVKAFSARKRGRPCHLVRTSLLA